MAVWLTNPRGALVDVPDSYVADGGPLCPLPEGWAKAAAPKGDTSSSSRATKPRARKASPDDEDS